MKKTKKKPKIPSLGAPVPRIITTTAATRTTTRRAVAPHPSAGGVRGGIPVAAPRSVASTGAPAMAVVADGDPEPQGLTASFWFDSGYGLQAYSATVRLSGRRVGAERRPAQGDSFVREETIDGIVPGSGPVSVTTRVYGVNAGEWTIFAEIVSPQGGDRAAGPPTRFGHSDGRMHPANWCWRRWALTTGPESPVKTRWAPFAPFAPMPAVIPGSWTGLVALGIVIGFVLQAPLLAHEHVAIGRAIAACVLAVVAALVGAKLWYLALRSRPWRESIREGWCIQGALVGAVVVATAALTLLRLPIGVVLDATAPALFVGVAVGRLGCFFTGCCAGRPTASRWAVWSSDRRVGARRVPTQLLESLAALLIGLTALIGLLRLGTPVPGALFVGSFAAYTLCRQLLLNLRAEARKSAIGAPLTAALAALVLAADAAVLVVGAR